jgi:dTDP-D-glucose 4,6-dehydratase
MLRSGGGVYETIVAYNDKKVVGVFVCVFVRHFIIKGEYSGCRFMMRCLLSINLMAYYGAESHVDRSITDPLAL